jgi:hypothetical protein
MTFDPENHPLVAPVSCPFWEVVAGLPADAPGGDYARSAEGWRYLGRSVGRGPGELRPDEAPWVEVAEAVNAGNHDGLEHRSEIQALLIGVRSVPHPECRRAAKRLAGMLSRGKRAKAAVEEEN